VDSLIELLPLIRIYGLAISPQYEADPADSLMEFLHHQNGTVPLDSLEFYGEGGQLHQMNEH